MRVGRNICCLYLLHYTRTHTARKSLKQSQLFTIYLHVLRCWWNLLQIKKFLCSNNQTKMPWDHGGAIFQICWDPHSIFGLTLSWCIYFSQCCVIKCDKQCWSKSESGKLLPLRKSWKMMCCRDASDPSVHEHSHSVTHSLPLCVQVIVPSRVSSALNYPFQFPCF